MKIPHFYALKQNELREQRNTLVNRLGANGYFTVLKHEMSS